MDPVSSSMTFLSDIYLARQILIPAAPLIWLMRELIGNSDGFTSSLDTHEARGRSLGSESANCGSLQYNCGRTNGFLFGKVGRFPCVWEEYSCGLVSQYTYEHTRTWFWKFCWPLTWIANAAVWLVTGFIRYQVYRVFLPRP